MKTDPLAEAIAAERALLSSTALASETDPTNDYKVFRPTPCPACNGYHGSVNAERLCHVSTIAALRGENAALLERCKRHDAENPRSSRMK